MQKNTVNESDQYENIPKNIPDNEPDDINENETDEKKVAYVSDISVSIEGSYLILLDRASIPVERLEPKVKGKSYNNILAHKVKEIDGNI